MENIILHLDCFVACCQLISTSIYMLRIRRLWKKAYKHVLTRKETSCTPVARARVLIWRAFMVTFPLRASRVYVAFTLTGRVSKSGCFLFQGRIMCPAPGPAPHPKEGLAVSNTPPHIRHRESTDTGVARRYKREWLRGRTFSNSSRAASRPCRRNVCTSRRRRSQNGSTHSCWRYNHRCILI